MRRRSSFRRSRRSSRGRRVSKRRGYGPVKIGYRM